MFKQRKYVKGAVKIGGSSGIIWTRRSTLSVVFSSLAVIFILLGVTLAGIPIVPMIWYRLQPGTSEALAQILRRPVTGFAEALIAEGVREAEYWQPPVDETLPLENMLIIEKIGVETELVEAPLDQYEAAFRKGVWRVPNFGTPYDRNLPVILSAHRFGYLNWTNAYRFKHSFYKLPDVEVGDRVVMIWGQRKYVYEIYEGEEGEEITNYAADIILYTCRFLESDVRIFRYGRLIRE
jgi:sortase (surface protein transpeptidase)